MTMMKTVLDQVSRMNREEIDLVITAIKRQQNIIEQQTTFKFAIGDQVKFQTREGRAVEGFISKINRKTIKVSTLTGQWKVSPSLLSAAA
jgi:hypothetical protein